MIFQKYSLSVFTVTKELQHKWHAHQMKELSLKLIEITLIIWRNAYEVPVRLHDGGWVASLCLLQNFVSVKVLQYLYDLHE